MDIPVKPLQACGKHFANICIFLKNTNSKYKKVQYRIPLPVAISSNWFSFFTQHWAQAMLESYKIGVGLYGSRYSHRGYGLRAESPILDTKILCKHLQTPPKWYEIDIFNKIFEIYHKGISFMKMNYLATV